eukprot:3932461-Rhodomonas_salina.1
MPAPRIAQQARRLIAANLLWQYRAAHRQVGPPTRGSAILQGAEPERIQVLVAPYGRVSTGITMAVRVGGYGRVERSSRARTG